MRKNFCAVSLFLIMLTAASPALSETGPCQEQNASKKIACLNKRIGDLEALIKSLVTQEQLAAVKAAADAAQKTANSANAGIASALKDVVIESATRPGVCLMFTEWTTKPEKPAWSVLNCGAADGPRFNVHK